LQCPIIGVALFSIDPKRWGASPKRWGTWEVKARSGSTTARSLVNGRSMDEAGRHGIERDSEVVVASPTLADYW
jgi:hypothetical protein